MTNQLTIRPKRLEPPPRICLALPEAHAEGDLGGPDWRVRDRISAMQKGNFPGGRPLLWLKAHEGAQRALVGTASDRFFIPPYVGHKGWVGIYVDGRRVDRDGLADLIE